MKVSVQKFLLKVIGEEWIKKKCKIKTVIKELNQVQEEQTIHIKILNIHRSKVNPTYKKKESNQENYIKLYKLW